jgi:hypothetical protein
LETRAICNVSIDSAALKDPVDPETGELRSDMLRKNMAWVLDEVQLHLKGAEFCRHEVHAVKCLPVACNGACSGVCTCVFGLILAKEREAMRAFHKGSEAACQEWQHVAQKADFERLEQLIED